MQPDRWTLYLACALKNLEKDKAIENVDDLDHIKTSYFRKKQ